MSLISVQRILPFEDEEFWELFKRDKHKKDKIQIKIREIMINFTYELK